jgi:aminoglycoside phosphotransferase (APT) family kinase protein
VSQFRSGFSNLTYLLRYGSSEIVLRRPPFGAKIKSAHDMSREYRILSRLKPVYSKVPAVIAFCEDESIIGSPFYLMERIPGIVLRAKAPPGVSLTSEVMRSVSESLIDNLVAIHAVDFRAAGLEDLGRPEGYVKRQVDGWSRRYNDAQTEEIAAMRETAEWLRAHIPLDSGACLIHNDYKYDNVMLDPNDLSRIVAVLDWEMATIGDPLMDLGSTLGYWIEAGDPPEWRDQSFGLTMLPGNLTRMEIVGRYELQSGRGTQNILFYYVYALFKIAAIVQQIYKRHTMGHSHDERFAKLNLVVKAAADIGVRAIQSGRISESA